MTQKEFNLLYYLDPQTKILKTQARIREFYNHFAGQVFLSFSGGKDSTVLANIVRHMEAPYNEIEFVFFDTHNEDPTVYEIVNSYEVTKIESLYTPQQVVEKVGYPLFNKEQSHVIDAIQRNVPYIREENYEGRSENNKKLIDLAKGKYALFTYSPLRISDKCCNITKKNPSKEFTKKTGKYPILATLAVESFLRMQQYRKRGCNAFEGKIQSTPIAFWSQKDILWYIANKDLRIAECYKPKITAYPLLGYKTCELCGKQQTGCLYCGFGKGVEFAKRVLKSKCPEYVEEHRKEFDALH